MNYSNLTLSERETLAYMSGDSTTAALLAQLDDAEFKVSVMDQEVDEAHRELTRLEDIEQENQILREELNFANRELRRYGM